MKKLIFLSTVLILGSFNMMWSQTITFQCADGHKVKVPATGEHTSACAKNPSEECCECVLGQAICNIGHGGLKPGSFPEYCNTACFNATTEMNSMWEILSHLKANQGKNIPVKNFWRKVTIMLYQQGYFAIP